MNPLLNQIQHKTRRHFLQQTAAGIGGIALSSLLAKESPATEANPPAPKKPLFPGKAKRVIYLHMTGSPPNLKRVNAQVREGA